VTLSCSVLDRESSRRPYRRAAQPSKTPSSPSPLFPSPLLLLFHFKTPKQAAHRRPLTAILQHLVDFCCLTPNHEQVRRCATHLSESELSQPRPCPSCAGSPVCHHSSRATRTDPDVTCRQQLHVHCFADRIYVNALCAGILHIGFLIDDLCRKSCSISIVCHHLPNFLYHTCFTFGLACIPSLAFAVDPQRYSYFNKIQPRLASRLHTSRSVLEHTACHFASTQIAGASETAQVSSLGKGSVHPFFHPLHKTGRQQASQSLLPRGRSAQ
jgi:hypothetical protein